MGKISEIMLLKQPKQPALAVEVQTDMNGMSEAIGKNFVKIDSLFKEQGEVTTDIPYVEYPNFESLTEHNIKMIIGLKSSKELQGEGDIRSITIPERKIVSCLHRGTYSELAVLYNEMMEWIKEDKVTFKGTCLPQNAVDESGQGSYFVLYKFRYGYADNELNSKDESAIDIDWAVNSKGQKVHLPGVDFIKIYTGVNQENGWLGECSTEISGVEDLHVLGVDIDARK